jgi:poly(3-hydroxybutyrate) depolymerase
MRLDFGRRRLLAVAASLSASARATPSASERFDIKDLRLDGAADLSRRAWVVVPRNVDGKKPVRVLVLWHGLGETTNERAGVGAWVERYGLLTSYDRLARPPVTATDKRGDLGEDRAREITRSLERWPFDEHVIFVCPYTPNVWKLSHPQKGLDRLADWVLSALLPRVSSETSIAIEPSRTSTDGCSLGGFVGLEIFIRRPQLFAACGGVQAAFGEAQAPALAARLGAAIRGAGTRRIHIETSRDDPFRSANLALSRQLRQTGVAHDQTVLPGPHDQAWLREAGTLEMLLWHDRALTEAPR